MVEDTNIDVRKMSKGWLLAVRIILIISATFTMLPTFLIFALVGAQTGKEVLEYNGAAGTLALIVFLYLLYKFITKSIKLLRYLFSKTKFDIVMKNINRVAFGNIISVAVILIHGIISEDYVVAMVVVPVIGMSVVTFLPLLSYVRLRFINQLKNINETQLKMELESSQKNVYHANKLIGDIYVTENFIYAPGISVVCIKDILWMHLYSTTGQIPAGFITNYAHDITLSIDIKVYTNNGKKIYVKTQKANIAYTIMNDIQRKHPNILLGDTLENRKKYKELLKK